MLFIRQLWFSSFQMHINSLYLLFLFWILNFDTLFSKNLLSLNAYQLLRTCCTHQLLEIEFTSKKRVHSLFHSETGKNPVLTSSYRLQIEIIFIELQFNCKFEAAHQITTRAVIDAVLEANLTAKSVVKQFSKQFNCKISLHTDCKSNHNNWNKLKIRGCSFNIWRNLLF